MAKDDKYIFGHIFEKYYVKKGRGGDRAFNL